jgi:hypothetical protein
VAVQAQAGFEPQRVACAEPGRCDTFLREQQARERFGVGRADRDLETVLAVYPERETRQVKSPTFAVSDDMNGIDASPGARRAMTAPAAGPCSASSARSARISKLEMSSAARSRAPCETH